MWLANKGEASRRWQPELGFEVRARVAPALDRGALVDRFVTETIEGNRLACGGVVLDGANGDELHAVIVKERNRSSCTNRDRRRIERWLSSQRGIDRVRVGPLRPAESDGYDRNRASLPKPEGKAPIARALSLRREAIAAFRKAAAVLGRPEVQEAASNLERSVTIVQSAVDEAARPLLRRLKLTADSDSSCREIAYFADNLAGVAHQRGGVRYRTPLQKALMDLTYGLNDVDSGIIQIPDMHEFERTLVGGSRTAIEQIAWLYAQLRLSAKAARRLREAAQAQRERTRKVRADRKAEDEAEKEKKKWPVKREVIFKAERSVRMTAMIDDEDATIIPASLAKVCGATVLPANVEVYLRRQDDKGDTDYDRSDWITVHPALVWISVPRTKWKAAVLAGVVPTNRCPVPQIGEDWFEYAVRRRDERGGRKARGTRGSAVT